MDVDISVIIPTYNRKERLRSCLDSLFNQDYPAERIEIIVVDDGTNDEVARMVENLGKGNFRLRYLSQYCKGPAAARNAGVKASLGDIIAFCDDDCLVDCDWVRLMLQTYKNNPKAVAVGGYTNTATQKTQVIVSQFLSTCSIENCIDGKKEIIFFPTCNVSFRREALIRHQFDEKFPSPGGEDLEFFWRLFKEKNIFIWNKKIKVLHQRNDTLRSFLKQAYIYGRGNFLVQYLHKDHPLLKELKTGRVSFWVATLINVLKIPRFSFSLGQRLIKEENIQKLERKLRIYLYFMLHKISYIAGNIIEFFRIHTKKEVKGSLKPSKQGHIPRLLIFDITHSCNLQCRICDIWKTASQEEQIEADYIKKVLKQAKHLGIEEIALSGGEPLFRRDIFDIFDYARGIKIKNLGVLTNGILIEEYLPRLKPYLLDNTISLVISLDSLTPPIHNYLRNSDLAWQKTINGLNLLSDLKKEHLGINFNIIAIILNQNLEELIELAEFIKSLGANSLQFQALLANNLRMAERKRSFFWINEEEMPLLDKSLDELIDFKKHNPKFIKNSINNLALIKKYYRGTLSSRDSLCLSAYDTVLISNQGTCCTCFSSYGDIKKESLLEIIQGEAARQAWRETHKCLWPCLLPCFCDREVASIQSINWQTVKEKAKGARIASLS